MSPPTDRVGPILITGLDHSGKTGLRLALGRSTSLSLTRRSELWTAPHRDHASLDTDEGLATCLRMLLGRVGVAALVHDRAALVAAFRDGPATHTRLYRLIHEHHAARAGAARWGDQDSQIELVADRLVAELPDARFAHLVVDPRRRYASLHRSRLRRAGLVGAATAAWVASARRGLAMAHACPDRYRVVTAESLETEDTMAELLGWLGVDDVAPTPVAGAPRQPIRARDEAFIVDAAGAEMRTLGYSTQASRVAGHRAPVPARFARSPLAWGRYLFRLRREPSADPSATRGAD
jgi:hypothetical protein